MQDKKRFPCAFVDLKKAFDSVYRNALWFKLLKMGLDGKILRILVVNNGRFGDNSLK